MEVLQEVLLYGAIVGAVGVGINKAVKNGNTETNDYDFIIGLVCSIVFTISIWMFMFGHRIQVASLMLLLDIVIVAYLYKTDLTTIKKVEDVQTWEIVEYSDGEDEEDNVREEPNPNRKGE